MIADRHARPVRRALCAAFALALTVGSLALAPHRPASAAAGRFTFFSVPRLASSISDCQGIAVGSDKNLWFSKANDIVYGRISITGTVAQHFLPFNKVGSTASENWIAAGPDGALWMTLKGLYGGSKIARITTNFNVKIISLPGVTFANGITAGPDGNMWVADQQGTIDRVGITGTVTEFNAGHDVGPQQITTGPDGNLWFTDASQQSGTPRIGRITPSGQITHFVVPLPPASVRPDAITTGPDGNLWVTLDLNKGAKVGRITPSGAITLFALPHPNDFVYAPGITTGPDGNLWVTFNDKVSTTGLVRITPSGQATEFMPSNAPNPTSGIMVNGITVGPDKALWFAFGGSPEGGIGRFSLP